MRVGRARGPLDPSCSSSAPQQPLSVIRALRSHIQHPQHIMVSSIRKVKACKKYLGNLHCCCMKEKIANFKEIVYIYIYGNNFIYDSSSCSYFASAYNKNFIQRKLRCSVFQFTDAAFQWHFKAFTEFKQFVQIA